MPRLLRWCPEKKHVTELCRSVEPERSRDKGSGHRHRLVFVRLCKHRRRERAGHLTKMISQKRNMPSLFLERRLSLRCFGSCDSTTEKKPFVRLTKLKKEETKHTTSTLMLSHRKQNFNRATRCDRVTKTCRSERRQVIQSEKHPVEPASRRRMLH